MSYEDRSTVETRDSLRPKISLTRFLSEGGGLRDFHNSPSCNRRCPSPTRGSPEPSVTGGRFGGPGHFSTRGGGTLGNGTWVPPTVVDLLHGRGRPVGPLLVDGKTT